MWLIRGSLFVAVLMFASMAQAHVSRTGQDYGKFRQKSGLPCCDGKDCRPTTYHLNGDGSVVMFPDGNRVVIPRGDLHQMPSEDGHAHWCGVVYPNGEIKTFCAILPLQTAQASMP